MSVKCALVTIFVMTASSLLAADYHQRFRVYYYQNSGYQNESYRSYLFRLSKTASSHDFEEISYGIDALRYIFRATGDTVYLDDAVSLVGNILSRAMPSNQIPGNKFYRRSPELGWIDNNSGTYVEGEESQLYEGKLFKSVCPLIYEMSDGAEIRLAGKYQRFVAETLQFITNNVWSKWYKRSFIGADTCGRFLLDGRAHMASHWATVAMYLRTMTAAGAERGQYDWLINKFNCLLRQNLQKHPLRRRAYTWNSTWNAGWRVGTACAAVREAVEVQDTDHANEVISYLIKAQELNLCWTKTDLKKMARLFTHVLWIPAENAFHSLVLPGSFSRSRSFFIAEGFAKLALYSSRAKGVLERFAGTPAVNYSRQGCQLMAILAYNMKRNR